MPLELTYENYITPFRSQAEVSAAANGTTLAAEIKLLCDADTRHVRDIKATSSEAKELDMLDLLGSKFRVLLLNDDAGWYGPLVKHMQELDTGNGDPDDLVNNTPTQALNAAIRQGFDVLKTNLQITNRPVSCFSDPEIGLLTTIITGKVAVMTAGKTVKIDIDGVEVDMTAQEAMDHLTGGLLFAGVTEDQLQGLIDAEVVREQKEQLKKTFDSGLNTFGVNTAIANNDSSALVNGLQNLITAIEAL